MLIRVPEIKLYQRHHKLESNLQVLRTQQLEQTIDNNNQYQNNKMNLKSKKYYQLVCELNKQNITSKQHRNKTVADNDTAPALKSLGYKNSYAANHAQAKNVSSSHSQSLGGALMPRSDSRKNVAGKAGRNLEEGGKEKSVRLPKLMRDDLPNPMGAQKKHCRSYKKIVTELNQEDYDYVKTLSPKQNMKQLLMNIVKNKENRHLASIDQQIDRLEALTKRYSCLRKDLVSIQEDILTISFKQRIKGRETSHSSSVVFG